MLYRDDRGQRHHQNDDRHQRRPGQPSENQPRPAVPAHRPGAEGQPGRDDEPQGHRVGDVGKAQERHQEPHRAGPGGQDPQQLVVAQRLGKQQADQPEAADPE